MLQSTFLTRQQLGLGYDNYLGLILALRYLEDGNLKTKRWYTMYLPWNAGEYLDMKTLSSHNSRGTTSYCIAGLAYHLHKRSTFMDASYDRGTTLHQLFYPFSYGYHYITPAEAAKTLRVYLETGVVSWR